MPAAAKRIIAKIVSNNFQLTHHLFPEFVIQPKFTSIHNTQPNAEQKAVQVRQAIPRGYWVHRMLPTYICLADKNFANSAPNCASTPQTTGPEKLRNLNRGLPPIRDL